MYMYIEDTNILARGYVNVKCIYQLAYSLDYISLAARNQL